MSNAKGNGDTIDARLVRKLADILRATELTEIEVAHGELKIRVAREITVAAPAPMYAGPALPAPVYQQAPAAAPAGAPAAATPAAPETLSGEPVKSPMVGTIYLQAQPGDPPFIKAGDKIKAGQTMLIIEAMKTMNPIAAPRDGVVQKVLVNDSQPVEFGEHLVILE